MGCSTGLSGSPTLVFYFVLACRPSGFSFPYRYPPLLSFVGGWLRFCFSSNLDVYTPYFPMGTFVSNVLASCLVAGVEIVLRQNFGQCQKSISSSPSSAPAKCTDTGYFLTEAVIYGICSSLSTMSTFIAELAILPKQYAHRYAVCTVVCSFFLALAIYAPLERSGN